MTSLVPHPCCDTQNRSNAKLGFSTQWTIGLIRCPECQLGVWNLHQPLKYDNTMVCAYCFDEIKKKGEPEIFDGLI
jgi:hypothetical protein